MDAYDLKFYYQNERSSSFCSKADISYIVILQNTDNKSHCGLLSSNPNKNKNKKSLLTRTYCFPINLKLLLQSNMIVLCFLT